MCRIARVDRFLEQWPQAEFGPGHIVLSDCNIDDPCVDACIAALDYLLDGTWPEDYRSRDTFADEKTWAIWRDGRDVDEPALDLWVMVEHQRELVATRTFLREFRAIHENDRIDTANGDVQCFVDDD